MSNRTCIMCDMYCIEDIVCIINQCPYYFTERNDMYNRMYGECPRMERHHALSSTLLSVR